MVLVPNHLLRKTLSELFNRVFIAFMEMFFQSDGLCLIKTAGVFGKNTSHDKAH